MKHIYIFQGKKYISAKRASKFSDYASDYIGQLCRAKKLDCQKIGKVWFVTEESLLAHKANVTSDDFFKNRIENIRGKLASSNKTARFSGDGEIRISTKRASLMTGYNTDYLSQLCRSGRLDAKMIGNSWMITKDSLKKHIENVVKEKEQAPSKTTLDKITEENKIEENETEERPATQVQYTPASVSVLDISRPSVEIRTVVSEDSGRRDITKSLFRGKFLIPATIFVVVAIFSLSISIKPTMRVNGEKSVASIFSAIDSIIAFLGEKSGSIFSRKDTVALNDRPDTLPYAYNGLAVVPSTGSSAIDERMKESIRASFSDQIAVNPDKSGTAGVITPIFRQAKGNDFVYVMVPVNEARAEVGDEGSIQGK